MNVVISSSGARATHGHCAEPGRWSISSGARPVSPWGQGRPASFASTLKVQRSAVGSGSGRPRTRVANVAVGVDLSRSVIGTRTAGFGASSSLRCIPAKVSLLNPQPALSLGGRNRSSCPTAVIRSGHAFGVVGRQGDIRRLQRSEETPRDVPKFFAPKKIPAAPPLHLGSEGVLGAQRGGIFAAPECIQRLRIDAR